MDYVLWFSNLIWLLIFRFPFNRCRPNCSFSCLFVLIFTSIFMIQGRRISSASSSVMWCCLCRSSITLFIIFLHYYDLMVLIAKLWNSCLMFFRIPYTRIFLGFIFFFDTPFMSTAKFFIMSRLSEECNFYDFIIWEFAAFYLILCSKPFYFSFIEIFLLS